MEFNPIRLIAIAALLGVILTSGSRVGVSNQTIALEPTAVESYSQLADGLYRVRLEVRQGLYYDYLVIPDSTGEQHQRLDRPLSPGWHDLTISVKGGYLTVVP